MFCFLKVPLVYGSNPLIGDNYRFGQKENTNLARSSSLPHALQTKQFNDSFWTTKPHAFLIQLKTIVILRHRIAGNQFYHLKCDCECIMRCTMIMNEISRIRFKNAAVRHDPMTHCLLSAHASTADVVRTLHMCWAAYGDYLSVCSVFTMTLLCPFV